MSEENKIVQQKVVAALNNLDWDALGEVMAEDIVEALKHDPIPKAFPDAKEKHMMNKDHKELIKRYYAELYYNHTLSLLDEFIAPDFYHRNSKQGYQWYRTFLKELYEAFPDIRFEFDDLIAERDIVICWGVFNCGVSVKEWAGVAPKGNALVFHGTVLHRIKDGKIIEQWHDQWYTSVPEMLEQGSNLEALPRPR